MKPRSRKAKGRRLQRRVAEMVTRAFSLEPGEAVSCPMSVAGPDVLLSGPARAKFPFRVECKNQERLGLWGAWGQASRPPVPEGVYPLLVASRNRGPVVAVVELGVLDWVIRGRGAAAPSPVTGGAPPAGRAVRRVARYYPHLVWLWGATRVELWGAWRYTTGSTPGGEPPVAVVSRGPDGPMVVCLEFDVLLELL
ncbi:MAG: hypothetical protein QN204_04960 [Armatimonadota bacterium]|nr:hypothetical protein [Armatimonadota bacterium]